MKKTLHKFVTSMCLLMLLLSATSCLHALHLNQPKQNQPKQNACDHCPKSAPLTHNVPSCCRAQQSQPSATTAFTDIEQPALSNAPIGLLHSDPVAAFLASPITHLTEPPPSPPLLALRI
jgi:hypothetical protein